MARRRTKKLAGPLFEVEVNEDDGLRVRHAKWDQNVHDREPFLNVYDENRFGATISYSSASLMVRSARPDRLYEGIDERGLGTELAAHLTEDSIGRVLVELDRFLEDFT